MDRREAHREEDLQRLRGFRLMDDDFMAACFKDNIECTELVLRIVTGKADLKVESVQTQYHMKNLQGRSVTLDIYASDDSGKKFNAEIQRSDKGAGAKRARYHSSLIDANVTAPGDDYEELAETWVIFITEHDVLGHGLPSYHIDRAVKETGEYFGDEAHIIYVNGEYRDDTPLGILMQDFSCTNPDDMQYQVLADRARYFKEDKEGIRTMCKMMEDMRIEERRNIARSLLGLGKLSHEEIAECAKLSLEEVKQLVGQTRA